MTNPRLFTRHVVVGIGMGVLCLLIPLIGLLISFDAELTFQNAQALLAQESGLYALWCVMTLGLLGAYYKGGLWRLGSAVVVGAMVIWYIVTVLAIQMVCYWDGLSVVMSPFTLGRFLAFVQSEEPILLTHFLMMLGLAYTLPVLALLVGSYQRFFSDSKNLLGNARFARVWDMAKMNLFQPAGIVLGTCSGKTIRLPGDESVLVVAPSGSGKTACIAIPNLIEWQGSAMINDLKGELHEQTASYRRKHLGQACYQFAPADRAMQGARYNPFAYVDYHSVDRIRDLQRIADVFIPQDKGADSAFWQAASRELLIMLAIYLFETEGIATFAGIHDLAKQEDFLTWLDVTLKEETIKEPVFYQYGYSFTVADKEKTQGNILRDFHMRMTLFSDPIVRYATSGNDFDLRQLRKNPMSVYITIPDQDKSRLRLLLTLLWSQAIGLMTASLPAAKEPHRVLMLLDEMGVMAPLAVLKDGLSFLRSYHVRAIVMVQYIGQLISAYGPQDAKAFLNAKVKMAFALNDVDDARYFSNALGQKTVRIKTKGTSGGQYRSTSSNEQFQSRPLLSQDGLMKLSKREAIVLVESHWPMILKKLFWFKRMDYKKALKSVK